MCIFIWISADRSSMDIFSRAITPQVYAAPENAFKRKTTKFLWTKLLLSMSDWWHVPIRFQLTDRPWIFFSRIITSQVYAAPENVFKPRGAKFLWTKLSIVILLNLVMSQMSYNSIQVFFYHFYCNIFIKDQML